MESIEKVLGFVLDAHAGDPQLLAVQLKASPVSVQRWISGQSKPRPAYEVKLRRIYTELLNASTTCHDAPMQYRVTPHHEVITEAVDRTLMTTREILHKRGQLSSRSQALDELSKLLFAHVQGVKEGSGGISKGLVSTGTSGAAVSLKAYVDDVMRRSLPESLAHSVDRRDFELRLKPQEGELAQELVDCFETLHRQTSAFNFDGVDILNEVFGKFLSDSFIDEKELGQYLTPPEVVRSMVALAVNGLSESELSVLSDPRRCADFGLILDPACGVASFLAEVVRNLRGRMDRRVSDAGLRSLWLKNILERVVVGIDKSERMIRLALTNMAMFGFPMARLYLANSLARNGDDGRLMDSLAGKARLILTNPPFGAPFQGNDLVKYKIATAWSSRFPRRVDSELLFIERYIDWLTPGGQLVAVVPDSILTNKAVFEDLRRGIAGAVELCSVVSLPSVTFGVAGTSTKTSILHLRKQRKGSGATSRTAFAVCQDIGFGVSTKANQRVKVVHGDGELPRILDEITAPPPNPVFVRWLEHAETLDRWDAQRHASLSAEVEQRLACRADWDVTVADVAGLVDERTDPRRWGAEYFDYIEISDIDLHTCAVHSKRTEVSTTPSRARRLVRAGDVLVSTVRPERGVVGVVTKSQDGSVCTTGLVVLRPNRIHPLVLASLMRTDFVISQLMRHNVGIAYPAIDEECLLGVLLPVRVLDLQLLGQQAERISASEEQLRVARGVFRDALVEAEALWRQKVPSPSSRPRSATRTTSRRRLHRSDSGSHETGIFSPLEGRTA
ncbi:MAG: N-6 DNA methylase [candidate division WOR-3 bacterium]|nr:N-6 DNA methylase [candidate division WOR-3 bacterium]